MIAGLIAALAMAVLYVALRWSGARAENAALRAQIAHLKRRLSTRDR